MAAPVGEKTRRASPRRAALIWAGLFAAVVVAFVVTVAILNSTVYSAGGFVRGYLDALNGGDTSAALSMAGVQPTGTAGDVLLTVSQEGELSGIREVTNIQEGDGSHRVTMAYRVQSGSPSGPRPTSTSGANGTSDTSDTSGSTGTTEHRSQFTVKTAGSFAGLFTRWQFSVVPTASLDITPEHDSRFTANGAAVKSKSADLATRYTVLTPAVFDLSHDTTYLTADTVRTVVSTVGGVGSATIDIEPKTSFTDKVKTDVAKYLRTSCLPQRVLLPSGCPFGEPVDDRLTSAPRWSMTTYPAVRLTATSTPGVWRVASAAGTARLTVDAQSLFDGHAYTIDEEVPFQVGYLVSIGSDNGLTIRPE